MIFLLVAYLDTSKASERLEVTYRTSNDLGVPSRTTDPAFTANGEFYPPRQGFQAANVMVVDDDMERWMTGPFLESYIVAALNDGGYSYDIFRSGIFNGTSNEFPSGDEGLSIMDDYEIVIWYSAYNTEIVTEDETDVIKAYLDGQQGNQDSNSTTNRNLIMMTQMADWFNTNWRNFFYNYLHANVGGMVVNGTADPMEGVEGSVFEDLSLSASDKNIQYISRPCRLSPSDTTAQGMLYMDPDHETHKYHAIQYPETASGMPHVTTYSSIFFAEEFGVFDKREDRAAFIDTALEWMDVAPKPRQDEDLGIGGIGVPILESHFWRALERGKPMDFEVEVTNYGSRVQDDYLVKIQVFDETGALMYQNTCKGTVRLAEDQTHTLTLAGVYFNQSGMNRVEIMIILEGDEASWNDLMVLDVGVALWLEDGEASTTDAAVADTDENGVSSFKGTNWHTQTGIVRGGRYAWSASNATTGEYDPGQDDILLSPIVDLRYVDGAWITAMFTNRFEDGDVAHMQIRNLSDAKWHTLETFSGSHNLSNWYMFGGDGKWIGSELPSAFVGHPENMVYLRFLMLADDDQDTERGLFLDDIVFRGTQWKHSVPDLTITRSDLDEVEPEPGDLVTTTTTITNQGTTTATGRLGLWLGTPMGGQRVNLSALLELEPGGQREVQLGWIAREGSFELTLALEELSHLDPGHTGSEQAIHSGSSWLRQPDISLSDLDLVPGSPRQGENVELSVMVANLGEYPGSGFLVASLDGDEYARADFEVFPDNDKIITLRWDAPYPDEYLLNLTAILDGERMDRNPADNHLNLDIEIRPGANLALSELDLDPHPIEPDQSLQILVKVSNTGLITTNGTLEFWIDDMKLDSQGISLEPHHSSMATTEWITQYGDFIVTAKLSAVDHEETTLADNTMTMTVAIPQPTPDLTFDEVLFEPEAPLTGQEIILKGTILNQGGGPSLTTMLGLYHGDELSTYIVVPELAPGEKVLFEMTWDGTDEAGLTEVVLWIDNNEVVTESDERNNQVTIAIDIREPSDPDDDSPAISMLGVILLLVIVTLVVRKSRGLYRPGPSRW